MSTARRAASAFALLVLLGAASAQIPDLSGMPDISGMLSGLGIDLGALNDPAVQANMEKCGAFFEKNNQAGADACSAAAQAASAGGAPGCPDACKAWIDSLPQECFQLISSFMPSAAGQDMGAAIRAACSGQPGPQILPPGPPTMPTLNITASNFSSTFECDAAAGFSWVALNPSLASLSGGATGAAAALNSTCRDLNATGCCAQAAPGNLTYAEFGLGAPMVVQGVRLTAPAGQCTGAAGDAGPCWQRLLGSWVLVGNASVQEQLASPQWAEAVKAMAALNATGAVADMEAARDAWLFGQLQGASSFCNIVTNFDLFEDASSVDGSLANNGAAPIGCGLGAANGRGMAELAASLGLPAGQDGTAGGAAAAPGMAVVQPVGSWVVLARLGEEDPLAVCGVQVCAKPAPAAAPAPGPAA